MGIWPPFLYSPVWPWSDHGGRGGRGLAMSPLSEVLLPTPQKVVNPQQVVRASCPTEVVMCFFPCKCPLGSRQGVGGTKLSGIPVGPNFSGDNFRGGGSSE